MQTTKVIVMLLGVILTGTGYALCNLPTEFTNAFKNGAPKLDFRLRQEDSKQQYLQTGYATTLRTAVGFETAEFYQTIFKVELIDVSHFFGMHYNPGASDLFLPQYTLIADAPGAGITEAKVTYNGFNNNSIVFGRQYIALDNQRFVGPNDFRQYPQSFDALSWNCTMLRGLDFYYAYLLAVNTNYGNGRASEGHHNLSSNIINLDWDGGNIGRIGGYAYLNNDHDFNNNSNITIGLRYLSPEEQYNNNYAYLFEFAWQQSQFNNPVSYNASYLHVYLSKTIQYLTGLVGYERLSGNKTATNKVFITPLGSVDNFNGMAEVFTTPPARGLQDIYADLCVNTYDLTVGIAYHFFLLDKGNHKMAGQEIDLYADFKITSQIDFNIAFASYTAINNVAPNTKRFWVMITANLL